MMGMEGVIVKFKMLTLHLPAETKQNLENSSQDKEPELNPRHPEYETEVLTKRP
jgi:hypothetical protein